MEDRLATNLFLLCHSFHPLHPKTSMHILYTVL